MINISQLTTDTKTFASALNGKWERKSVGNTTWVILGQIVFLEGNANDFPYEVISWHSSDATGNWGILK